jgi:crotonobetainyl-CoA:carnitine CoA-transferase CaiB-like acyl-CoA transferase
VSVVDPALGVIREIAQLVRVSDAAVEPHVLAPELGQHTDEVLSEIGYSAADIDKWRARGAIR